MGAVYADMSVLVHDVLVKGGRGVSCAIASSHAGKPDALKAARGSVPSRGLILESTTLIEPAGSPRPQFEEWIIILSFDRYERQG